MADLRSTDTFDLVGSSIVFEARTHENYYARVGVKLPSTEVYNIIGFMLNSVESVLYLSYTQNNVAVSPFDPSSYKYYKMEIDGGNLIWSTSSGGGFVTQRTVALTDLELLMFRSCRVYLQGGTAAGTLTVGSVNMLPEPKSTGAFLPFFL